MKKKIEKIRKKIKKFAFSYFNLNKSIINDYKYDLLVKKLKKLETKYPQYKKKINLHKYLSKTLELKKHNIPMLSIKNTYNIGDISKYIKKIKNKYKKVNFCCELKIDGIALSLIYKNNLLIKALTRGDGIQGENIINNIKNIKNIPLKIKNKKIFKYLEIRGEVFISKKNFIKINKTNKKNKKKIFSNQRNLTAGTIRTINKENIKKRNLSFIAYDLIINKYNRLLYKSQIKCLKKIKKLNFSVSKYFKKCYSIKKIKKFYNNIKKKRKIINFEIDGIVIKINNRKIQNKFINKTYIKWAIAYKFNPLNAKTKFKKIKYKIGRTGIIIPIAIIKPINMGGSKIKKINIYNINYLNKLQLSIGDNLIVEKRGDIIPKIKKIIKNKKNIIKINKCPFCKKKINIKIKYPKCLNKKKCIKQLEQIIINFTSKNGLNIKYLGPKLIKKLFKNKYINTIHDIFQLSEKKIQKVKGINIKLSKKIIKSIKNSLKNVKLNKFIYSLSIPHIGKLISKEISKKFKKLKKFLYCNSKSIQEINGIGKKKCYVILNYLNNKKNIKSILKISNLINFKK